MDSREIEGTSDLKILFISHDASRSGAPILLLSFLRWLKLNTKIIFEVVVRSEGELLAEFEKLGPVHLFSYEIPPMPERTLFDKVLWRLRITKRSRPISNKDWAQICRNKHHGSLLEILNKRNFSVIYSNTVVNGDVLDVLSALNIPIITHVHELEDIIQIFIRLWPAVKAHTNHYIAASQAVKNNLIENHEISPASISVVHEYVSVTESEERAVDRRSLGLPDDVFLVCGSAKGEWRKGPDLFILLAERVVRLFGPENYHFMWVGGWATEQDHRRAIELVNKLDLSSKITFTGVVENPRDFYGVADVFAMVSREDPFPLVCLEAAAAGVPILCFDKAGGMPEFVETDAGFVVPFSDIQIMAEKIELLFSNPRLRADLGMRAKQKVREIYNLDQGCERLLKVVTQVVLNRTELKMSDLTMPNLSAVDQESRVR